MENLLHTNTDTTIFIQTKAEDHNISKMWDKP